MNSGQRLGLHISNIGKIAVMYILVKYSFIRITFELIKIKNQQWHHRVSLLKTLRMTYDLTLKGQTQNLTSGQGHVMTDIGHVAYQSMRLDDANTMKPFLTFYLYSIKSY